VSSNKNQAFISKDKNFTPWIVTITIVLNLAIVLIFFMPKFQGLRHFDLTFLPMMNAIFNSFTFIFLSVALYFIKLRNITLHRRFIFAAFTTTFLFLLTYVFYHLNAPDTHYGGEGVLKYIYFFILISHIILAVPTVLIALYTAVFGLQGKTAKHRKIARWTMPIWLYVSLTGVLVYIMISPYYN
jgi:putative membrane protein